MAPRIPSDEEADETDFHDIEGLAPDDEGEDHGAEGQDGDDDQGDGDDQEGALDASDEGSGEEGEEEAVAPRGRQSDDRGGRAGKTISTLRADRQRERERADRLERELQEARNRPPPPPQQPQETPQQEADRLALMTAEERMQYKLDKSLEGHRREMQQVHFHNRDIQDKSAFQVEAVKNPLLGRFGERVEKELTKLRSQGGNADRLVIAQFLIGKAVMDKSAKATTKQKQKGQQAIRRETVRPMRAGSDTSSTRREANMSDSQRRRVENMNI